MAAEDRTEKRRLALALADGVGCLLNQTVPDAGALWRAWTGRAARVPDAEAPRAKLRAAWNAAKVKNHG